ncbi:hypothetical protein [Streptomyces sp. NPDC058401]|uniref:hypothetical protein n=1 Tax=Streptomyces sp. NPDC058401 TaxID=3346480 RepID=UPI0036493B83
MGTGSAPAGGLPGWSLTDVAVPADFTAALAVAEPDAITGPGVITRPAAPGR